MKIAILVGHGKNSKGGYDTGACSRGYEEFQIAKEIAKNIFDSLQTKVFDINWLIVAA